MTCFSLGFSIITGGPGIGKTVTVSGVIEAFRKMGKTIALAAPTGKVAMRMNEAFGKWLLSDANTIHRLLEFNPNTGFNFNREEKLMADVCIVDEVSMLVLSLCHSLFSAFSSKTQVVFVGDVDHMRDLRK